MDMFSGFTTQVSSWMGAKKQEGAEGPPKSEEENVTPTVQDAGEGSLATGENKKESPTKGSSRLEMFANVKSQMTSWLGGSNVASGDQAPAEEGISAEAKEDVKTEPVGSEKSPADVKEDDDSSATGGADSDAAPSEGSPGEEKDATSGFGAAAVSTKAIQGAKSIGSFLFSAVNKAGKTVSEAGAKIKKTVEENSLV
ncbi:hypothetical protein J437_LFUL002977 [Ladona fulva]|uniref:Uncharacterized protein n=1 Tax=Ladona fulva TaxID=123851 RepID=A0A8K0P4U0_LADFU|nr:hypothetical protein J437_LFUL002977 [Ladona fulva]